MKTLLLLLFNILALHSCFSQQKNTSELEELERQLGVIQGILETTYHKNPYNYETDKELSDGFEAYQDSLQLSFYTILEQICKIDTAMEYNFPHLASHITIAKSPDSKIRIFSRNTYLGGSMPYLCSYVQYISDSSAHFSYMPEINSDKEYDFRNSDDSGLYYDTIYMFSTKEKLYYLPAGKSQVANLTPICALRAISISNDKVNNEHIFVTSTNKTNSISISYSASNAHDYNQCMYVGDDKNPRIIFSPADNLILQPEVKYSEEWPSGEITGNIIIFKWQNNAFFEQK